MLAIDVISTVFLAAGAFFMIIGTVGLLKFPDFYTRLHATGKCDTLGQILIIVGCMTYEGLSFITINFLCVCFLFISWSYGHARLNESCICYRLTSVEEGRQEDVMEMTVLKKETQDILNRPDILHYVRILDAPISLDRLSCRALRSLHSIIKRHFSSTNCLIPHL